MKKRLKCQISNKAIKHKERLSYIDYRPFTSYLTSHCMREGYSLFKDPNRALAHAKTIFKSKIIDIEINCKNLKQ